MKFKKINGTLIERYLWQGLTRLLAIYDANDNILIRFQYADSRLPVAMESGGATYYLAYDQVGSLRLVTDVSGNVIKALDYDSFGNIIQDTDPLFDMPFSFAGGMIDTDTGLIRFGFREYCPEIGRWTAKDPILFLGGSSDLYGYCVNDPINWVDKSGLLIQTILMATGHGLWASQEGTGAMIGAVIGTVTGEILGMAGTEALSIGLGFSLGLLGGEIGHLFDPPKYDEDFGYNEVLAYVNKQLAKE